MILVDIFVPAVDKTYNFSLNEYVSLASVVDEITEMIGQKEHAKMGGGTPSAQHSIIRLYRRSTGQALPRDMTLADCDVKSGESLILV